MIPALQPHGPLAFLPGQWVDFAVPGITAAGGYSFTSTPRQLQQRGTFELAVRRSAHPVAAWLHDKVQEFVGLHCFCEIRSSCWLYTAEALCCTILPCPALPSARADAGTAGRCSGSARRWQLHVPARG